MPSANIKNWHLRQTSVSWIWLSRQVCFSIILFLKCFLFFKAIDFYGLHSIFNGFFVNILTLACLQIKTILGKTYFKRAEVCYYHGEKQILTWQVNL